MFSISTASKALTQGLSKSRPQTEPTAGSFNGIAWGPIFPYVEGIEVHFTAETEKKLKDLASQSGRGNADELVQDVVEGYFDELAKMHEMIGSRYDDLKSGRVKPIDGDEFFEILRRREDELLKKQSPE